MQIPGWEGYYSASNLGRIKSEPRIITEFNSTKTQNVPGKILKQTLNNSGKHYWRVSLSKNSKIKYSSVHQLVCWAFLGEQGQGIEVRHLDGNCRNNRLDNLAYGTRSENITDAKAHGTFPLYEKRPGAILTKQKAIEIAESKKTLKELSKEYGVHWLTIRQIKIGETWSEITKEARASNPYKTRKNKPRKQTLS